jgi:Ca2+-binding RTX toxin-like protein
MATQLNNEYIKNMIAKRIQEENAKQGVLDYLKSLGDIATGGGDINYADVANLISGMAVNFAGQISEVVKKDKRITLAVEGKHVVVDTTSNAFDSAVNGNDVVTLAKALAEGIVGGAASLGIGSVLLGLTVSASVFTVGAITVTAFVIGNQMASLAGHGFEYVIGPEADVVVNTKISDIKILSEGSVNDILHRYWEAAWWDERWGNPDKDMHSKETWIIGSLNSNEWIEKKDGVYNFSQEFDTIAQMGDEFDSGALYNLVHNYLDKSKLQNGFQISTKDNAEGKVYALELYSKDELKQMAKDDVQILSAMYNLKPFSFEHVSYSMDINPSDISDAQLEDLTSMLYHHLNPDDEVSGVRTAYKNLNNPDVTIYDRSYGGIANSVTFGTNSSETINGSGSKDRMYGNGGDDILNGYYGNDTLEGNAGNDTLSGGLGDDILKGGKGDDRLEGGDGNDTLYGDDGSDILIGGEDNDTYTTSSGDIVVDTSGNDRVVIQGTTFSTASFLDDEDIVIADEMRSEKRKQILERINNEYSK